MHQDIIGPEAKKLHTRLVDIRRDFHMHPELSNKEFRTTARINDILEQLSVERLQVTAPTGTAAIIRGDEKGPVIAIRADIDALPIQEQNDLPYKSKIDGISHACGHDFHTSVALGAVMVLNEVQKSFPGGKLPGTVKFLFQPAEEAEGGAESMIAAGLLQNPKVDAIIGLHNNPEVPIGQIGVKSGFLMASVDDFTITIKGKGGHAAIPENAIDPIVIGSSVVQLLQTIVSRTVSPKESAVVTVGQIHAGNASNVIPDQVFINGTVRTSSVQVQEQIESVMRQLVTATVEAMGATAEFKYERLLPPVINDSRVAAVLKEAARKVVGAQNAIDAEPSMGGEDFSFYQQVVPGCYYWLGTGNPDKGVIQSWHHPKFNVDEDALVIGAAMMAQAALDLMDKLKET